jgi:hypothetical protein
VDSDPDFDLSDDLFEEIPYDKSTMAELKDFFTAKVLSMFPELEAATKNGKNNPRQVLKRIEDANKAYLDLVIQFRNGSNAPGPDAIRNGLGSSWDIDIDHDIIGKKSARDGAVAALIKAGLSPEAGIGSSPETALEQRLAAGVALTDGNKVLNRVTVPLVKNANGDYVPSLSASELKVYAKSLKNIETFFQNNSLPDKVTPDNITIHIQTNRSMFSAEYKRLFPFTKQRNSTLETRVMGVNMTLPLSGQNVIDLASPLEKREIAISINHNLVTSVPSDWGKDNSIEETIAHEFGHTLHNVLDLAWGTSYQRTAGEEAAKDYKKKIYSEFITDYAKDSIKEHFSESFAKYVLTGKASPEFKRFLAAVIKVQENGAADSVGNSSNLANIDKLADKDYSLGRLHGVEDL